MENIILLKNKEKAPNLGSRFGQDVEPTGYYAIKKETDFFDGNPNYETVSVNYEKPLLIPVSEDSLVSWKYDLFQKEKAKGKFLTNKLLKQGYDIIITQYENGDTGEIIVLDANKINKIMADGGNITTKENIQEQIEQRLQDQQKNKEFKDVGRVAQTRKEKMAYKLISSSVLSTLEQDPIMAFNMVKKDNVWPEINIQQERERGVNSGALYLKVKIREAAPTKPKDDKDKRALYVRFLEMLQNDLIECYTVNDIAKLAESYRSLPMEKVIGYFINPEYLTADEETKIKIQEKLKLNSNFRVGFLYGSSTLVQKLVEEVFGAKFRNMLFKYSDAASANWQEAKDKEPITDEQSEQLTATILDRKAKFIQANEELKDKYSSMSVDELKRKMVSDWRIPDRLLKEYKSNPEDFRKWAINYYDQRVKGEQSVWDKKIIAAKPKDNDWDWLEKDVKIDQEKSKAKAINTKEPLSYIKRIGGYKIEGNSPQEIIDKFGFSAVNYGVYVNDEWSKSHTKHFLGAVSDLGDILNINIKQLNELGKLSIAFGAKGRKGHLATYFPQTKDINLTKGNGDGSVAHEWGHYFDNVIVEMDTKRATNSFASENNSPDYEIKLAFKNLMDFFYKGNDNFTPRVPMRFYAKNPGVNTPEYYVRENNSFVSKKIEIRPTIEETLEQVREMAIVDKDRYFTQLRVFGYIIDAHGIESYDIPMKLKTSYFYHKSAYNYFQYCHKTEKSFEITVETRTKYWTSAVELFARAWETVVLKKLLDKNRVSNYLVADIPMDDIISEAYYRPYPAGLELGYIETLIENIIFAVKNKFGITDFEAPSSVREDEYMEITKEGKDKIGVVVEDNKLVEEVVDTEKQEATETLEMLIKTGTEEQITEWQETINNLKK